MDEQIFTIGRDVEFSVFLQNADGSAADITGHQYRFRLYPKSGTGVAPVIDLAFGEGVSIGDAAGGRVDIAGGLLTAVEASYGTCDLTRTDTGANLIVSWPVRIAIAGTPTATATGNIIVKLGNSMRIQAASGFGGPVGSPGASGLGFPAVPDNFLAVFFGASNTRGNDGATSGSTSSSGLAKVWRPSVPGWAVSTLGEEPYNTAVGSPRNAAHAFGQLIAGMAKNCFLVFQALANTSFMHYLTVANGGISGADNLYDATQPAGTRGKLQTFMADALASSQMTSIGKTTADLIVIDTGGIDRGIGVQPIMDMIAKLIDQLRAETWCGANTPILFSDMPPTGNYGDTMWALGSVIAGRARRKVGLLSTSNLTFLSDGAHYTGAAMAVRAREILDSYQWFASDYPFPYMAQPSNLRVGHTVVLPATADETDGLGNVIGPLGATPSIPFLAAANVTDAVYVDSTLWGYRDLTYAKLLSDPMGRGYRVSFTTYSAKGSFVILKPDSCDMLNPITGEMDARMTLAPDAFFEWTRLGESTAAQLKVSGGWMGPHSQYYYDAIEPLNALPNGDGHSYDNGVTLGSWTLGGYGTGHIRDARSFVMAENPGTSVQRNILWRRRPRCLPGTFMTARAYMKSTVASPDLENNRLFGQFYDGNAADGGSAVGAEIAGLPDLTARASFTPIYWSGIAPAGARELEIGGRASFDIGANGSVEMTGLRVLPEIDVPLAPPPVIAAALSAHANNFAPAGFFARTRHRQLLRVTPSLPVKITGIGSGLSIPTPDGAEVEIENVRAAGHAIWLEQENTSSAAENRFDLPGGMPAFLFPGDSITLRYNAQAARWCVKDWPNRGEMMGFDVADDFVSAYALGTGQSGSVGRFIGGTVGVASNLQPSSTMVTAAEKALGVVMLSTGTDTTGRAEIGGNRAASGDQIVPALGPAGFMARVARATAVDATNTYTLVAGFTDGHGGTWTDGVAWELRWNGSAEEWSRTAIKAGTATRQASASPTPDDTFIWLGVLLNADWSEAYFIWSQDSKTFTRTAAITTNIPGSATPNLTGVGITLTKSAGATSRNAHADLMAWRYDVGARG